MSQHLKIRDANEFCQQKRQLAALVACAQENGTIAFENDTTIMWLQFTTAR